MYFRVFLLISFLRLIGLQGVSAQSYGNLSGTVRGIDNAYIPSANVRILNTQRSTYTDPQGNFSLGKLNYGNYSLQISAGQFATQIISVRIDNEQHTLHLTLRSKTRQLDEVVVSSLKNDEELQMIPVSITALPESQIRSYMLRNLEDISAIVPNLLSAHPGDMRNVSSIRGITTTSYEPAVATYIDGVSQFGLDTYMALLHDVESIEVLRGPQGTLFGRNAMGGVINVRTKKPGNKTRAFAYTDIGNYGLQRYGLGIHTPLVKDKLFFGATGMYSKHNGFYTNSYDSSNYDRKSSILGSYYLNYFINNRWSATINFKHNDNRNFGAFPLVFGVEPAFENPFEVNQNAKTEMVDQNINASLSINYDGETVNFSAQTAYLSNYRYYKDPIDADFSPLDGIEVVNNYGRAWNNVKVLTQELRLSSAAGNASPIRWITGLYAFMENDPVRQGIYFGENAGMFGAPMTDFTSISTNMGENFGLAAFAHTTWKLTDKLDLGFGLRHDYEHRKLSVRGEFQPGNTDPIITQADTATQASFNAWSPKVSLSYHLTQNRHLHFLFSRGFRAGGITQLSSDPSEPPLYQYQPEQSINYEVGLRNVLAGGRLQFNIAAFYSQVNDVQVPILIMPDAITITRNAGRLVSKGFELEASALPIKGLRIDYALGYTHATFADLSLPEGEEMRDFSGNRQIFTPDITSMLAVQYNQVLSNTKPLDLFVRGEWRFMGDHYFDLANSIKQNAYSLFNLRAGVSNNQYEISIWSRNIGGKKYIGYAYDFGAVRLGDPATFGISLFTSLY
ncbi:MAG: TonB-dependent receptor [Cyclobacteriaceae bacterium]